MTANIGRGLGGAVPLFHTQFSQTLRRGLKIQKLCLLPYEIVLTCGVANSICSNGDGDFCRFRWAWTHFTPSHLQLLAAKVIWDSEPKLESMRTARTWGNGRRSLFFTAHSLLFCAFAARGANSEQNSDELQGRETGFSFGLKGA